MPLTIFLSSFLFLGTIVMLALCLTVVSFIVLHQRRVNDYKNQVRKLEQEKKEIMINASVKLQEEERQRIAADLHDDAGPLLASARMYLTEGLIHESPEKQLQNILGARQIIDEAVSLIRNMSHNLMPPTLKNFGLESAVLDMSKKISLAGQIKCTCRFHDYDDRLESDKEQIIFRILQEVVYNVMKYSKAAFIHITQHIDGKKMYIRVNHDGTGILQHEFDELSRTGSGLGLKNIASRIQVLKAKVLFDKDLSNTFYRCTIELNI